MSATETLAIPQEIRDAVDERDRRCCRCCGRWLGERRTQHHIFFGGDATGMGGRRHHEVWNCITLGEAYLCGCHQRVHAEKGEWQWVLAILARNPDLSMTATQYKRWSQR